MTVSSIEFIFLVFLCGAVFWWLPTRLVKLSVMTACDLLMLYVMLPNASSWITLGVLLSSGYCVATVLRRWPRYSLLALYLLALVAAFLVIKKYDILRIVSPAPLFEHSLDIVGVSYILFRQIHFVVDSMQGQIQEASPWEYLSYQLSLFTLLSGPIMRFQQFQEFWRAPQPSFSDLHDLLCTILRIGWGVIKLSLLASGSFWLYEKASSSLLQIGDGYLADGLPSRMFYGAVMFYAFPAYVYLNFSGYCDIVIASGRLFGLRVPENFDAPYLARNMIDYWNRWHRTLSHWIRDYVFMPLYKSSVQVKPAWAESLAILSFFIALFLAGVWHGATFNWVIFGLLNGLGVSMAKLWEILIIRHGGREGLRNYLRRPGVRLLAVVGNLHFACMTMLFFPPDMGTTMRAVAIVIAGK